MIKFFCPHCNRKLGVPDEYAGKRVRCSSCHQPCIVPAPQPVGGNETPDTLGIQLEEPPASPPADTAPDDDLRRNADITAASRSRSRDDRVLPPIPCEPSAKNAAAKEVAMGMGKIPLSLGLSFLLMVAAILLWVFVAKVTGFIFGILVLLVPTAGAWGLTRFTEHRGVLMGLLAAFIGLGGMMGGKIALARWVVYPMLVEELQDENSEFSQAFNEGFDEGFEEGFDRAQNQLTPQDVAAMIQNEEVMVIIAAFDIPLERPTIRAMFLFDGERSESPVDPAVVDGFDRSYYRLDTWNDQQKSDALRKHHPAYTRLTAECLAEGVKGAIQQTVSQTDTEDDADGETLTTDAGRAVLGFIAFLGSFVLLDLFWFPMGIYGAWKIGYGAAG
jgi:hypothetical protein